MVSLLTYGSEFKSFIGKFLWVQRSKWLPFLHMVQCSNLQLADYNKKPVIDVNTYNQLKDCNIEFYDYIIEINLNIPSKLFGIFASGYLSEIRNCLLYKWNQTRMTTCMHVAENKFYRTLIVILSRWLLWFEGKILHSYSNTCLLTVTPAKL